MEIQENVVLVDCVSSAPEILVNACHSPKSLLKFFTVFLHCAFSADCSQRQILSVKVFIFNGSFYCSVYFIPALY